MVAKCIQRYLVVEKRLDEADLVAGSSCDVCCAPRRQLDLSGAIERWIARRAILTETNSEKQPDNCCYACEVEVELVRFLLLVDGHDK